MSSKELTPVAYTEIKIMALDVVKSGLFPGIKTTEAAATLMMLCQADGIHPMEAMRRYHIIEGRPSKRADAMQAEFQDDGGRVKWLKSTTEECEAIFTHPLYCPEGLTVRVTLAELRESGVAMAQGGLKSNYKKFPRQTLKARVISEGVRAVDPGIIVGIYTPEEHEDPVKAEFEVVQSSSPSVSTTIEPDPILTAVGLNVAFGEVSSANNENWKQEFQAVRTRFITAWRAANKSKFPASITAKEIEAMQIEDGSGSTWIQIITEQWKRLSTPTVDPAAEIADFIARVNACTSPDDFKKLEAESNGRETLYGSDEVVAALDTKRSDFDDGMPV